MSSRKEKLLLITAPAMSPVTFIIFQLFNITVGGLRGYISGLVVYWIICLSVSLCVLHRS